MENKDKTVFPADVKPEELAKGVRTPESPSEHQFYEQMRKSLDRHATGLASDNPLETLYNCFHRFNQVLTVLGRPWLAESGQIQKACAYYLAYAGLTQQERDTFIETLNGFTSSVCCLAENNYFINRMQNYSGCQKKELKRLLDYQKDREEASRKPTAAMDADGDFTICRELSDFLESQPGNAGLARG